MTESTRGSTEPTDQSEADTSAAGCDDALHEIYTFLDGELTDERRELIKAHLDDCGPCLDAYDFETDLKHLVADRCRDEAPESLRQRIADAIAELDTNPDPI